ncbi:hypothetical protein BEN47_02890 [Hymenobacter lapidarius]|uniref:DUF3828 domain-containing protein n=1 Tax=Hymenobacter lapidarius TaxID=1908237 RepID=A0A1G1T0D3_9BACT|nr:DUF3828 domain-containing protein [Hymenobacter lapidarius]OGX84328.1 hypothetical protein BEN47_02890 [Hymenobacter lapidarius]
MNADIRWIIFCLGWVLLPCYGSGQARSTPADRAAGAMLKAFYTAYITVGAQAPTRANLAQALALQKEYCTASLFRKIQAQYASRHLETDPFLYAQDVDIAWVNTLSVQKDAKVLNGYRVSYGSAPTEKTTIHVTVLQQGKAVKIASIK